MTSEWLVFVLSSIGEALRIERQKRGKSVEDVERAIKIRTKYVAALEADDFDVLPEDAYAIGFIRSYAQFLGLDPSALAAGYRSVHESPKLEVVQPVMSTAKDLPRIPRYVWMPAAATVVVTTLGWMALTVGSALGPPKAPAHQKRAAVAAKTAPAVAKTVPAKHAKARRRPARPVVVKVVALESENWLSATVDGRRVFDGEIASGQGTTWRGRKAVVLRSLTPEVLLVYSDGRYIGHLGYGDRLVRRVFRPRKA